MSDSNKPLTSEASEDPVIEGRLLSAEGGSESEQPIRHGSPFAPGTNQPLEGAVLTQSQQLDAAFTASVASETARGGVLASALILPFALASLAWFPLGGVMVATLGSILGAFGLSSRRVLLAAIMLTSHALTLGFSCFRML